MSPTHPARRGTRRLLVAIGVALALGGCGGGAVTVPATGPGEREVRAESGGDATTDGPTTEPPVARCPASYGGPGPSCDGGSRSPVCEYPEGSCYCGEPPRCSGAYFPPGPPHWVCVPHRPACPEPGGTCAEGEVCAPFCCGMGVVCEGGRWVTRAFPCPP